MLNLTRPKFFIPIHGTLRHLVHHAKLAQSVGVPHGTVMTNGQVAEIDADAIRILDDRVPHGKVFIDSEAEEVPEVVVRDRQHLAEDGFVIVVVALDSNGRLVRDPEIITRGLVHVDTSGDVLEDVRAQLVQLIAGSRPEETREIEAVQEKMRAQHPTVDHPIVRTHPETGQKAIYVNRSFTRTIVGMEPTEGARLLRRLYAMATIPDVQCRFRWKPGSVAFWDNRATQHIVSNDFLPAKRVMERVTVAGDTTT